MRSSTTVKFRLSENLELSPEKWAEKVCELKRYIWTMLILFSSLAIFKNKIRMTVILLADLRSSVVWRPAYVHLWEIGNVRALTNELLYLNMGRVTWLCTNCDKIMYYCVFES